MIIKIKGLDPSQISEIDLKLFKSKILTAATNLTKDKNFDEHNLSFETSRKKNESTEYNVDQRAENYISETPKWKLSQLVLPTQTFEEIEIAVSVLKFQKIAFEVWGLGKIEPFQRSALNFYGPPGTGKTMAAHAIADMLGKNILSTNYAQLESMYHGVGPKNLDAVFKAAHRDNAILFIDEADSLLSKRLTNVTQGSEQAINSMRSQLLINLDRHTGIIIFATNLVKNYDYAFESRVKHLRFELPDLESRRKIWAAHLIDDIPKSEEIDINYLADNYSTISGRDIKNAVISACLRCISAGKTELSMQALVTAIEQIIADLKNLKTNNDYSKNSEVPAHEKENIKKKLQQKLSENEHIEKKIDI